ncbi:MAG: hypothetical protein KDC74_01245 [Flavobacteriaceae bacterium]|jgi:hypothetical protein|nr:hypothetical protein [Flavobacteriaceae bacterium]
MTTKDYLQDISEIKEIMNKSTRFMSLSGLSGVLAGTYALIGAYVANTLLKEYVRGEGKLSELSASNVEMLMIGLGLFIAFIAALTGYILTKRKAEKNNEKMWTPASKQMLMSFIVPMVTGGLFIMMLIQKGYYGLVAPSTLIFYGLALYNAGKYTLSQVRYLGLLEILLGLLALYFIYNGLLFWTIGFGVLHILYGAIMYFKLERE